MTKYDKKYFEITRFYSSNRRRLKRVFVTLVMYFKPKTVLDVGCGEGHLVKFMLEHELIATGMDSSPDAGELIKGHFVIADARKPFPFADKTFDVVVSKDFFEHIEEEYIDHVYSEMKRVGKNVTALISFKQEREFGDTHLTVRKHSWWLKKLLGCRIWIKTLKSCPMSGESSSN